MNADPSPPLHEMIEEQREWNEEMIIGRGKDDICFGDQWIYCSYYLRTFQ